MTREDRARVIQGYVQLGHQWVPIDQKVADRERRNKKLRGGLVFFQGEWIPIADKVARTVPKPVPPARKAGPKHVTINKQVYNIQVHADHRTTYEDHKHVHVDSEALAKKIKQDPAGSLPGDKTGKIKGPDGEIRQLPDGEVKRLPDGGDV
jgi:hypothetical protein